jgi:hypothetical protein
MSNGVLPKMAHNGLGLCDVVAFKAQKFNNPPKPNSSTWLNLALLPHIAKPLLYAVLF